MTIDTVEDAHSPKGPSSGQRIINCVGSASHLARAVKQGRASIYAAEGTAAHELSEWARLEGRPCRYYIGREIEVEGYTFTVDEEMADHVQTFVDWCEKEPGDRFVEVQVRYSEYMKGGYGRLDDARAKHGTVVITDLKYGKVPVYVESNVQLRMYALGFYLTFGHLYDIEAFRLRISQPRVDYEGEELITVEQLLDWAERVLRPAEEKIEAGVLEFNAGPWCKYCPLKYGCETRQQWIMDQVPTMESIDPDTEFEDLDSVDEKIAAIVNDPPVLTGDMHPDRLNLMLQAAPAVIKYFKDLQSYAKTLLLTGKAAPALHENWKLVPGRSTRVHAKAPKQVADALALELDDEDIWEPRTVKSVAQLEKKLGKNHWFFKTDSEYVEKVPGKPTLAPSSDRRKALSSTQLAEFEDLGEEAEEEN